MHLKISSAKRQPFCPGSDQLIILEWLSKLISYIIFQCRVTQPIRVTLHFPLNRSWNEISKTSYRTGCRYKKGLWRMRWLIYQEPLLVRPVSFGAIHLKPSKNKTIQCMCQSCCQIPVRTYNDWLVPSFLLQRWEAGDGEPHVALAYQTAWLYVYTNHDDVIKWKHFPRY